VHDELHLRESRAGESRNSVRARQAQDGGGLFRRTALLLWTHMRIEAFLLRKKTLLGRNSTG